MLCGLLRDAAYVWLTLRDMSQMIQQCCADMLRSFGQGSMQCSYDNCPRRFWPRGQNPRRIPSPCTTVKTQQLSFYTTLITVTQILNSPLNLKITEQSLSWTFSLNATIILFQHLFTKRRRLLACTQNGTASHLGNTK